jgi:hypothetical protein
MKIHLETRQHPDPGALSPRRLRQQNQRFKGSGGISRENRGGGFLPAFSDTRTGAVYLSRFRDGRPAPMHLLDGLPGELIAARTDSGRVTAVRDGVLAGFVRQGQFYTREQAASAVTGY